ncbi:MAG: hypothetical protein R6V12_12635 [Candidatus Hydrogenedentota bacterium]
MLRSEATVIRVEMSAACELYNLRRDVGETTDLAEQEPERLAEMSAKLRKLYNEVREESPVWPAWEWSRYEQQRIEWPEYWVNRKRNN